MHQRFHRRDRGHGHQHPVGSGRSPDARLLRLLHRDHRLHQRHQRHHQSQGDRHQPDGQRHRDDRRHRGHQHLGRRHPGAATADEECFRGSGECPFPERMRTGCYPDAECLRGVRPSPATERRDCYRGEVRPGEQQNRLRAFRPELLERLQQELTWQQAQQGPPGREQPGMRSQLEQSAQRQQPVPPWVLQQAFRQLRQREPLSVPRPQARYAACGQRVVRSSRTVP